MKPEICLYLRDNIDFMKSKPDKFYPLAIVDPPYGLNMAELLHKAGERESNKKFTYKKYPLKKWDTAIPSKEYFDELFRVSENQIIWGGNYFTEYLPPSSGWIVWDKMNEGFSFADGEMAWTSFKKAMRIFKHTRGYTGRIHPTEKPVKLYKWILEKYAKPGQRILDTHCGSGSILEACYDYDFGIDACEIDVDYFTAASKRLKNVSLQNKFEFP